MGTIEVARLGMGASEMEQVAEFISRILVGGEAPEAVEKEVTEFRLPYQTVYYCFENEYPAVIGVR